MPDISDRILFWTTTVNPVTRAHPRPSMGIIMVIAIIDA